MFRLLAAIGLAAILIPQAFCGSKASATRIADGFDFPLGAPNGDGYYKSRGFSIIGHLGEDWVSAAGPGAAYQNPVGAIGNGVVTLARDFRRAWGNVVVIRHAYLENHQVKFIDSLYGHLDKILVAEGQPVRKGQEIGTVGTAHGLYPPHLHFEVHKNLAIGVVHTAFTRDFNNYQDPTSFVNTHRRLPMSREIVSVAMNTYTLPTFQGIPAKPPYNNTLVAKLSNSEEKKRWNLFSFGNN
jgi:murein DD-endopeptidase MepM/ murein hydrolase activator NlpD